MVSHTQPLSDRTTAHRAASTTSSRHSTTSRRHRTSRSHTGAGSSYRPQNEFPNFAQTGDVEIVVIADGQERRYCLHRLILVQCSGFFEAGTSEEWSKGQAAPGQGPGQWGGGNGLNSISEDGQGGGSASRYPPSTSRHTERVIWRYELDWGNKDGEDEVPMLVQRQPQSTLFGGDSPSQPPPVPTKPPPPSYNQSSRPNGILHSLTSNHFAMASASHIPKQQHSAQPHPPGSPSDTIRDYDNLFRTFYNYPPILDSVNIAEAYLQCKSLLTLADMYDSLPVIGPRIDHHLLQFQSRLWKQIAKYPPSYLKLGYLARSKVIFAEALVHVVGQWPSGGSQLRHTMPEAVLELIEDKVDELVERKMRTEMKLLKLGLVTSRSGERISPSTGYTDWLALSLFRQWVVENTTAGTPKTPPPQQDSNGRHRDTVTKAPPVPMNAGTFYRLLGTGGSSYLNHDECKKFIKLMPGENNHGSSSREMLKRFERRMDEIKVLAKEVVRPLLKNYLELDIGRDGGGLGYLTCTRVEERDYPWDDE